MADHTRLLVALSMLVASPIGAASAQHPTMPPGMTHEEHLARLTKDADLKKRGAAAMGFDQDRATHHFRLDENGGRIEVGVKNRSDERSRDDVRAHLRQIAIEFTSGDFAKPFATHAEVPAGVKSMQQLRREIQYLYEDMPDGGRVRIVASNARAKRAIHSFLRYQIREHATGDSLAVGKEPARENDR